MTRSKQGFDPHDLESIAFPSDAWYLGTDSDGVVYYYSTEERTVYTFVDETPDEALDLNGRPLLWYIRTVRDETGWSELNYDASPMETIGKHIAMIAREEGQEVA